MNVDLDDARQRAHDFLAATSYFQALGLDRASADARFLARVVLDLAGELDIERGTRIAIQKQRDEALRILERHAGEALTRRSAA
jgi:hypothetical protein